MSVYIKKTCFYIGLKYDIANPDFTEKILLFFHDSFSHLSGFVSHGQGIQLKYHPATRTRFHSRLRSFGLRNLFGPGSSFWEGKKRGKEERAFLRVPFQDGTSHRKKATAEIPTSRITLNYRSSYEARAMLLGYCNFLFAFLVSFHSYIPSLLCNLCLFARFNIIKNRINNF